MKIYPIREIVDTVKDQKYENMSISCLKLQICYCVNSVNYFLIYIQRKKRVLFLTEYRVRNT